MDDPKAFEQLVVRCQGAVCAVAYAVLRDRARSEEIAQEAFLIAWQKLPAITPAPELPAWVCGIAKNLARNAARRVKELPMTESTVEPAARENPAQLVLEHERHLLAERALAELAEADREALVLYYRGDETFAGVASVLGIQETAARQRVHRARERLRSALAGVEASLRATRPSHAFTAACVAALAVKGGTAEAATSLAKPAAKRAWLVAPLAVLVVGGGAAIAVTSSSSTTATTTTTTTTSSPPTALATPARKAPIASAYLKRIAAEERAAVLGKLRSVGTSGSAPQLAARPTKVYDFSGDVLVARPNAQPPDPKTLTKTTMRYAIRDASALLLECYGEAFDRLPRKDGTLAVKLSLIGEPGSPTLVDTVELEGDAHLTGDAALGECMRETLYAIELPAMPAAEQWSVHYPLTLTGTRP